MTALQLFQIKIGVEPDGKFGPMTLRAGMHYYGLTKNQAAHFFGQIAHETGGFRVFEENFNYSATRLLQVFRNYFNAKTAAEYARKAERIANRVYANRMGNKDENSGMGWKYRGRGAIQLTGYINYVSFAQYVGNMNLVIDPSPVAKEYAFESAVFYFKNNRLFAIADKGTDGGIVEQITRRVNGGYNGLNDRKYWTSKFVLWLRN